MTIQEIISNLVKNRWSYGDIAKQAGVSKATISRWHKGTVKANKTLEEIVEKNLKDYVNRDKFDDQAGTPSYSFPSWDEVEKRIFTDDYYEKAISYHKRVIEELEKSRNAKKWKFTEDEKMILKKLPRKYKYIARDAQKELRVFAKKPIKTASPFGSQYWSSYCISEDFGIFNHKFKCIQWSDSEPCEFRKFI